MYSDSWFIRCFLIHISSEDEKIEEIFIRDEYIKLGQALKYAGLVGSGTDAKYVITEGMVKLNDNVVYERGKKCYDGDIIEFENEKVVVRNAH